MYNDRLKLLRERMGLQQKEIAKVLEISNTTYCDYENGNVTIPLKHLISLCEYFKVTLDYIFLFTDTKHYRNINYIIDKNKAGERLKNLRKNNNLTQTNLADFLNTTHSVVADYERGRYLISTQFLYIIAKTYNISADYLLGFIDKPKYFVKKESSN